MRFAASGLASPLGRLRLVATTDGLAYVGLPRESPARYARWAASRLAGASEAASLPHLEDAARQLAAYFAGARRAFDVPLDAGGTPFQRRVWRALAEIPYGGTTTYAALAQRLGTSHRAVGSANAANPLAIVVPCHRVVGSGGGLTGYAGGLDAKAMLLSHERA